jgi:hypothetical protein
MDITCPRRGLSDKVACLYTGKHKHTHACTCMDLPAPAGQLNKGWSFRNFTRACVCFTRSLGSNNTYSRSIALSTDVPHKQR